MHDLTFAIRMLLKSPVFTAITLLTVALGIGANTAIFSYVDRLLVRPLPVQNPEELVVLGVEQNDGRPLSVTFNYPLFLDYRRQNKVFTHLIAQADRPVGLSTGESTDRVRAMLVSDDYFAMLGVPAALGRAFSQADQAASADPAVLVISHGLWMRRFGGAPSVIGQKVALNGLPFTIIGVAPSEFRGTVAVLNPDLYVPITQFPNLEKQPIENLNPLQSRFITWHQVMGRLNPGVDRDQAQAGMRLIAQQIYEGAPDNTSTNLVLLDGSQGVTVELEEAKLPLILLMVIVGLVLLIACANIANLLLARATTRQREMAIRLSDGASRSRIVRQLLTESVVLAVAGGVAGLAVALWITEVLSQFRPPGAAGSLSFSLDGRILAFSAFLSILTGIIFGLVPAWQASRPQLAPSLKSGATEEARPGRFNLRNALVVFQLAISLIVLICGGLCLRSFNQLQAIDPGFNPARIFMMSFDLKLNNYTEPRSQTFFSTLLESARALPGVEAATLAQSTPLGSSHMTMSVERAEGFEPPPGQWINWGVNVVAPDHFRTLGLPILSGRDFNAQDNIDGRKVVIINDIIAQQCWPGQDPIGRRVYQDRPGGGQVEFEIVGVVKTAKKRRLTEAPQPVMYWPHSQHPRESMTLLVRSALDSEEQIASLRQLAQSIDPYVPVFNIRTMEQQRMDSLFLQRMAATMLAGFGLLALALATLGVYGVMSYGVSRRTREIGVRIALGAELSDVLRLILRDGAWLATVGLSLGLVGALLAARFLQGFLFGVGTADPMTFIGLPLLLAAVSLMACWFPARRACQVNPVVALRSE